MLLMGSPKHCERFESTLEPIDQPIRRCRPVVDPGVGVLGQRSTLAACLAFLEAHEPDLLSVAEMIGSTPAALVRARAELDA